MIQLMPCRYSQHKKTPPEGGAFSTNLALRCLAFSRHIGSLRAFGAILHIKGYCLTFCQ